MGASYQSPTVAVTSANNAFGAAATIVASVPFYARRLQVFFDTGRPANGAMQISCGSTVIVPFFPVNGGNAFSPPIDLDINIPKGSSLSVQMATYQTSGAYNVTFVLDSDPGDEDSIGFQAISPGVRLSNSYFQVSSSGAGVWTPLGGVLTLKAKAIHLLQNNNNGTTTFSFGYGPNSSSITALLNAVPVMAGSYYTFSVTRVKKVIPAGQILYAQQSAAGGAFWPLIIQ